MPRSIGQFTGRLRTNLHILPSNGPLIRDEEDYDILAAPCLEFLRCVKQQGKARKELVR